jgi:hypothetical protein
VERPQGAPLLDVSLERLVIGHSGHMPQTPCLDC